MITKTRVTVKNLTAGAQILITLASEGYFPYASAKSATPAMVADIRIVREHGIVNYYVDTVEHGTLSPFSGHSKVTVIG